MLLAIRMGRQGTIVMVTILASAPLSSSKVSIKVVSDPYEEHAVL